MKLTPIFIFIVPGIIAYALSVTGAVDLGDNPDPELVARCLGLDEEQIVRTTHAPVMASLGLPFVISELADRAALASCTPDIGAFRDDR